MTQGLGQARVPTTRFPLTESPNLKEAKKYTQSNYKDAQKDYAHSRIYGQAQEQMHWLVSEDHPVDAGSKQNNTAQIWKERTQENNTQKLNQIKCIPSAC